MKVLIVLTAVLLLAGLGGVSPFHQAAWANDGVPAGAASINVNGAQLVNSALVRAFIPTGSKSVKCLATMNESTDAMMGTVFFCGERDSTTFGSGVLITILYPSNVSASYGTSLTVWQSGARYYGAPIVCTDAGVC